MIFFRKKRYYDNKEWHKKFLWLPTRIDDSRIVWLETVWRQLIIDDEGSWAGGFKAHWEYLYGSDPR